VTANREAVTRLGRIADAFLFHNRDIHTRVDDSVVRVFEDKEHVLRRSRGYAPYPVNLHFPVGEILACGAELKNTFCLTKEQHAFLSQHIGDLENYETLMFFEETLQRMKELFRIAPRAVAYDLHPLYLSTKLALAMTGVEKIGVQHHHAHIASCMAENGIEDKVIGVAFDGTGYGTDGKIWGGEFLVADFHGFARRAHFRYIPLAGGDTAVREPWRIGLGYLLDTFGARAESLDLPLWPRSAGIRSLFACSGPAERWRDCVGSGGDCECGTESVHTCVNAARTSRVRALRDVGCALHRVVEAVCEISDADGQRQLHDLIVIEILLQFLNRWRPNGGRASCHPFSVEQNRFLLGVESFTALEKCQTLDLVVRDAVFLSRS
jgi:hypothetical protein